MTRPPSLVPELVVTDLAASVRFWCDLIGFQIAYDRPEDGFACLDLEDARVMLEQRDPQVRQWITGRFDQPFGRGINLELQVPAVMPILARLEAVGWPLFMGCEEKWYRVGGQEVGQRQFLVQDPDGYLLRPAESLGVRSHV